VRESAVLFHVTIKIYLLKADIYDRPLYQIYAKNDT